MDQKIKYLLPALIWSRVKICEGVLVAQSCLTLCDPIYYSQPGSSVHGIFYARILEWIAIPFSKGSSQLRDRTRVSCIVGRYFTVLATIISIKNFQWGKEKRNVNYLAVTSSLVILCTYPRWLSISGFSMSVVSNYWGEPRTFKNVGYVYQCLLL